MHYRHALNAKVAPESWQLRVVLHKITVVIIYSSHVILNERSCFEECFCLFNECLLCPMFCLSLYRQKHFQAFFKLSSFVFYSVLKHNLPVLFSSCNAALRRIPFAWDKARIGTLLNGHILTLCQSSKFFWPYVLNSGSSCVYQWESKDSVIWCWGRMQRWLQRLHRFVLFYLRVWADILKVWTASACIMSLMAKL